MTASIQIVRSLALLCAWTLAAAEPAESKPTVPAPTEPGVELRDVVLTGDLTGGQAVFTLTATARVKPSRGASLDLLAGPVALLEAAAHPRWQLRIEEKRFVLAADRSGDFPVRIRFHAGVTTSNNWHRVAFRLAPGSLQKVLLQGVAPETQFEFPGAARPEREGDSFVSYLPPSGAVELGWKEARPEAEGRLFFAAEALNQVTVSPGLLRQTAMLEFRVMQGELRRLTLLLQGDGEVTRVQGEQVRAWTVTPAPTNGLRRLEITFNQPQKEVFGLLVQLQLPLGAFPQTVLAPQLRPEGATRFAGHVRVVNDGAVRLEVLQAGGLSQISPEQFPQPELFKALALPASGQVFAYRFSGAEFQLSIRADTILPELGVSQVLVYHLGENELAIDADIELDVREAPLRELQLQLPRGYAVARLTASGMSDYTVGDASDGQASLVRLLYGTPVAGRQVIQLRLERNSALRETAWVLPRLEVLRAKSVRGHIGVAADAGFRLTPASSRGLTDVATAFFPKKLPGLQAAFRISEPEWQATMTVERIAQSIQADVLHLFSVAEGVAYGSSVIQYAIAGAPISTFRVELSPEYFNVEFTGKEIRNWQKTDGGFQVQLHTPVTGAYTLLATYERPFKAQGETLAFTGARPLDAQSEQGHSLVTSAFQFQVQPANVSTNLLALEPGEVPPEYRLFFDAPILAAYRYTARPFNLQLALKPLAQGETVNQVVDRAAFTTRISAEGQVVTDVRYFVKSKGATHLRVTLPLDTQLWSATVNGTSVVPVAEPPAQLIPLPQQADPNAVQTVELKVAGRATSPNRLTIAPPAVGAPVLLSEWRLIPDTGRQLTYLRGTLPLAEHRPDPSGFAGVAQLFTGTQALPHSSRLFVALALLVVALLVTHQTASPGVHRHSPRHLCGLALVILSSGAALTLLGSLAATARQPEAVAHPDLRFLMPVLPASAAPSLDIANRPAAPTLASRILLAWPAIAGVALWLYGRSRNPGPRRLVATAGAWALFAWAALRSPGGASAFGLLMLAALFFQVVLPMLRCLWNLPPRPEPPMAPSPAGATSALVALTLLVTGEGSAHAQTNLPPTPVADALVQTLRVEDDFALVRASFRWTARKDQSLPLLSEPAVITRIDYPHDALLRSERREEDRQVTFLKARRAGTYDIVVDYQLRVTRREGQIGLTLPVRPALVHRVSLDLQGVEADLLIPQAVSVKLQDTAATNTVAEIVLPPTTHPWIGWRPRTRDTRLEKTVLYAETQQLYVPSGGVLEGIHQLIIRPAQGEISELVCQAPAGATVTDVAAPQLSAWRFDPDTRQLRVTFQPTHPRPFTLTVRSQLPTGPLPYTQSATLLRVPGAVGEIGLVGIATGNEVQLDDATAEGCTPINLEDFPGTVLDPLRTQIPGLTVRRAFRYSAQAGPLALKASAVEPDVRVESQQTLSLGEDRIVLAANLSVEITRAGIFRLSFRLPEGLDVESISGPALSHWTELKEENLRTITLHLKGKTEGQQALAITLSGPGLRGGQGWSVPRLAVREAAKQRGQLVIVPEQGMRLQVGTREGLTQLDPAKAGIRQKGVLVFRLLQDPWQLSLDLEQVDSWIQATSLQDVAVGDAQAKVTANLHYEIENTGVRSLTVRLPAGADSVRFKGEHIADFVPHEVSTNATVRDWEIKLHRRVLGRYPLQVSYQLLLPGRPDQTRIQGVEAVDASLQRGFLTLRAEGRLQLQIDTPPPALQAAEWQSIPRTLQSGVVTAAANYTYRLVEPGFDLPVKLQRREAVKLLPARVNNITLTSVISDDGVMLTQTRMELTPGNKRLLHLTLPANAQFWFAFVNQSSVWPWREGDQILIPLESHGGARGPVVVEFFHTLPTAPAKGGSLDLEVAGPKFDLPLENLRWRVLLNGRWQVQRWRGNLELESEEWQPAASLNLEDYARQEAGQKQEQIKAAEQFLNAANTYLQQGAPQQARRAFQMAYGLSQHDNAFNEDARVQLHNLKMQQALIGLNARQSGIAGEPALPALKLQPDSGEAPTFTQDLFKQVLERNSAEDNAVQARLAERLVQQQDAAVPNPAAIRASIPEEGRILVFTKSLLVDPWADLKLKVEASAQPTTPRGAWILLPVGLFLALVALAWSARLPRKQG